MNFSSFPFFSTAVAVIVTWALFAILCSFVHEAIVQVLAERGRFMKMYLSKQLKDIPNGFNWASLLYMNGPVSLLTRDPAKPTNDISPRRFAESIVLTAGEIHAVKMKAGANFQSGYSNPVLHNLKMALAVLHPSDVTLLLRNCLSSAEAKAGSLNGKPDEAAVYNHLLQNVEDWFSDFAGRMTLWYKKKTRKRLFLIAAVISCIINLDSINVFSFYRDNPVAATAMIDYYQKNQASLEALAARADTMKVIVVDEKQRDSVTMSVKKYAESIKLTQPADSFLKEMKNLQKSLALPVGTDHSILQEWGQKKETDGFIFWFWKLLGIVITGFTASFGAPFWFDVLRKIYSRSK